ncbi:MAG: hypothetical protein U0R71_15265 [Solirubrobacterales bacterium]
MIASEVALELLAWDKARYEHRLGSEAAVLESLIERGAGCYRRLLLVIHGEQEPEHAAGAEPWLRESQEARLGREDMTDRGGFLKRPQLRLTASDPARIDRRRPELSFTGAAPAGPPGSPPAATDPGDVLERLARLHAEGVLSDEELAAARARAARPGT